MSLTDSTGGPWAHSAKPAAGILAQTYKSHVVNVVNRARRNGRKVMLYASPRCKDIIGPVRSAATLHDLGKLAPAKQEVLGSASKDKLPGVRHERAGQVYLAQMRDTWAASLVAAHHEPLFDRDSLVLQGKEWEWFANFDKPDTVNEVINNLPDWLSQHVAFVGPLPNISSNKVPDPVSQRISLSCLVDADYSDTAAHEGNPSPVPQARRRWAERLLRLRQHVESLDHSTERSRRRQRFFEACCDVDTDYSILSCSAPVGSGKTFGVAAHILRVAIDRGLRHIFIVLPYTNIVHQTALDLRSALVLEGEDPEEVVAELHHQADFSTPELRGLAATWRAPIIVTTAVNFFETLSSSTPARLRKLHELPGSAVFVDEAHAAMPNKLLPLAWQWMVQLAEEWRCHFVLGSGTLFKFWNNCRFPIKQEMRRELEELTPHDLLEELLDAERIRVVPTLIEQELTVDDLINLVGTKKGATVVVCNTVQTAATVAGRMAEHGDAIHLSTALAPIDREPIITEIIRRLANEPDRKWTLVSTSCVEAGLNLSFRHGFREASTVASLLQLGGRVRRNEEAWAGELYSFQFAIGEGITKHPEMKGSSLILRELLESGAFREKSPTELLEMSFARSLNAGLLDNAKELLDSEDRKSYPKVDELFSIIDSDTRIVIVRAWVAEEIEKGGKVSFSNVIKNSVQIYASKLPGLPCRQLKRKDNLWVWTGIYDPDFLGYLADKKAVSSLYRSGSAFA